MVDKKNTKKKEAEKKEQKSYVKVLLIILAIVVGLPLSVWIWYVLYENGVNARNKEEAYVVCVAEKWSHSVTSFNSAYTSIIQKFYPNAEKPEIPDDRYKMEAEILCKSTIEEMDPSTYEDYIEYHRLRTYDSEGRDLKWYRDRLK